MKRTERMLKNFTPVLLALAAVMLVILSGCTKKEKKKATDYLSASFSGLNSQGKLTLSFDKDRLLDELLAKKQLTEREKETFSTLMKDVEKDYVISQKDSLSNGDKISITGGLDKNLLKDFGISFENDTLEITVDGLIEEKTLKIRDYLTEDYSGFEGNGYGYLHLDYEHLFSDVNDQAQALGFKNETEIRDNIYECLSDLVIEPNRFELLENGENITSSITCQAQGIEQYGILFDKEDFSGTVNGLAPMETLSLEDYLELELDGFDSFATANAVLDAEKLTGDLETILREDERGVYGAARPDTDYPEEARTLADAVRSCVRNRFSVTLSASEALSNEDTITITASLSDTTDNNASPSGGSAQTVLLSDYGLYVTGGEKEKKIEGLPEKVTFDISPYLSLDFSGFDGSGTASLKKDAESFTAALEEVILKQDPALDQDDLYYENVGYYLNNIESDLSPQDGLSEGDEVVARISLEDNTIPSYGILLEASPIREPVSGLIPVLDIAAADYFDVSVSGYNGAGTVSGEYDRDALTADVKAMFEETGRGAYGFMEEDDDPEREIENAVSEIMDVCQYQFITSFSRENHISNGDVITVTAQPSDEEDGDTVSLDSMGIRVHSSTCDVTAGESSALPLPREIDLAKAVSASFSGICPFVTVSLEVNQNVPYLYQTGLSELSGTEEIRAENGDTYSINISYGANELLGMGYVVKNNRFEAEISGLPTWHLDLERADDERLETMLRDAQVLAKQTFEQSASRIEDELAQGSGWIIWDSVSQEISEVWYAQPGTEDRGGNRLCAMIRFDVPVRGLDRSITRKEIFCGVWKDNVTLDPYGKFVSDEDLEASLYFLKEECENALTEGIVYMLDENPVIEKFPCETGQTETSDSSLEDCLTDTWRKETRTFTASEAAQDAVSQCAAGPVTVDGHTYYRFDSIDERVLSWDEAETYCENAGGHLVTITSPREQAIVNYLLREAPMDDYWAGAQDLDFEGGWKWVTGEAFGWKNWRSDQPDNYWYDEQTSENWLEICPGYKGQWNDYKAFREKAGFILETDPQENTQENGEWLCDLLPTYTVNEELREYVTDPYGNTWFRSLAFDTYDRAVTEYDLARGYDTLTFTLSTDDSVSGDSSMEIVLWGDEQLLFSSFCYTRADAPIPVTVDISEVNRLSIQTRCRAGSGELYLNDAWLAKKETAPANVLPVASETEGISLENGGAMISFDEPEDIQEAVTEEAQDDPDSTTEEPAVKKFLSDLSVISSNEAKIYTPYGIPVDLTGRTHRDAVVLDTGNNGNIVFCINGCGKTFTAILTTDSFVPESSDVRVSFLADGKPLGAYNFNSFTGPVAVSLDIEDVRILTVCTSNVKDDAGSRHIILGDLAVSWEEEAVPENAADLYEPAFPDDSGYRENAAAMITCGNERFYRFDKAMTWIETGRFCEETGGLLAMPKTDDENNAIAQLISDGLWQNYNSYWLGGAKTRSGWIFNDGEPAGDPERWNRELPEDISGMANSLCILDNGHWADKDSAEKTGFIMQVHAEDPGFLREEEPLALHEMAESSNMELTPLILNDTGTWYQNGMMFYAGNKGWAKWDLGGRYASLSCLLKSPVINDVNYKTGIAVFGDGRLLYSVEDLTGYEAFTIDVSGVGILSIMSRCDTDNTIALCCADLVPGEKTGAAIPVRLSSFEAVDETAVSSEYNLFYDSYREAHDDVLAFNAGSEGFILYNLAGKYTEFTGKLVSGSGTRSDAARTVRIFLDNDLSYESDSASLKGLFGQSETITLDLTGVSTMRIETASETDSDDQVYLVDDKLN